MSFALLNVKCKVFAKAGTAQMTGGEETAYDLYTLGGAFCTSVFQSLFMFSVKYFQWLSATPCFLTGLSAPSRVMSSGMRNRCA